jgi:hypothetical protein
MNLQIVRSQFFTNKLIFIYIRYNLNIYWFIGILIHCQRIQTNSYSMSDNEGNFKLFANTYALAYKTATKKVL